MTETMDERSRYLGYLMRQLQRQLQRFFRGRLVVGRSETAGPGIPPPYFYIKEIRTRRLAGVIPLRREERLVLTIHAGVVLDRTAVRWVWAAVYLPLADLAWEGIEAAVNSFANYIAATHVEIKRVYE